MQQDNNSGIHEDDRKGQELAAVLKHYGLLGEIELADYAKIICPLHDDVNASMKVDFEKGTYFCFGCNRSGEAVDLVREIEHVNSLQAYILFLKILKGEAKNAIKIKHQVKLTPKEAREQARLYFYSLQRPSWRYIKKSYMHSRGFDSKTLIKVDARLNQNKNYGIAMPMMEMGRFKGYVLRATTKEASEKRKYLYSKGFSRSNTLVGEYDSDIVIVCEGYMDWLKFVQHGKNKAVAILGWKATEKQIEKLKQNASIIISALDNTPMGRKGTTYLRKKGFDVIRFRFPPHVKDPGDLDDYYFNKAWSDTMRELKRRRKTNG